MTGETRKGRSHPGAKTAGSALADLVRRHDPDRYRTALFAPAGRREALFALYAFNYEIARVRESVTQPMLGQIRLQWWREVVEAAYAGAPPRTHVVAAPLTAAIREFHLSRVHLDRLIDSRERDLDDAAPADLAALAAYAEGTSSALVHLALEVLDAAASATVTAAREVGIAYAMAGLMRAVPFHACTGRCCLPEDIAASAGLDLGNYSAAAARPALRTAVRAVAAAAAAHLTAARDHCAAVPRAALPALLPAIVAERALARLQRAGWDPFEPRVAAPDPLLTWRLAAAMLARRF